MNRYTVFPVLAAGLLAGSLALAQQNAPPSADQSQPQVQTIPPRDLGNNDIRKVQSALNEAGYNAGTVDGVWGAGTTKALRDFQRAKGLNVSGRLDQDTVLALGFSRDEFAQAAPEVTLKPADVRQVQEALNKAGYKVASVDGRWGPSTVNSLRDFQKARGLQPTGRLDHDTVLALGLSVSDFAAGEFSRGGPDSVNR